LLSGSKAELRFRAHYYSSSGTARTEWPSAWVTLEQAEELGRVLEEMGRELRGEVP
jgi:hypothetical protein